MHPAGTPGKMYFAHGAGRYCFLLELLIYKVEYRVKGTLQDRIGLTPYLCEPNKNIDF